MIEIRFKKYGSAELETLDSPVVGCWINVTDPNTAEIQELIETYNIPLDFIHASLDEDEQPRFDEDEDSHTKLAILKVPDRGGDEIEPATVGLIFVKKYFFTISRADTKIIKSLKLNPKNFYTTKHTSSLLQILWWTVNSYISHLDKIDRKSDIIGEQIKHALGNDEIFQLLAIQKTLAYFKSATQGTMKLVQKLSTGKFMKLYDDDKEFLEDIVIENEQALEKVATYISIISNTMGAYSAITGNNMNQIMKTLTMWSILLAFPAIVAAYYGANVALPLQNSPGIFVGIVGLGFFMGVFGILMFRKLKWI
ncbi:MAG: magnesium transporter CorA family protein [Candidatus Altiarchaeota archaeon]|nr:magnesium transporter CorA family protein [Candidatus Altiarchaeota archaeon]